MIERMMGIFVYLFFLYIGSTYSFTGTPNFCSNANTTNCSSKQVSIYGIKDDILLTTSPKNVSYLDGTYADVKCSENHYEISVPLDEVAFWKTGDAIHLPSLSTFFKARSCLKVSCEHGKEYRKLKACLPQPVIPVCSQSAVGDVEFNKLESALVKVHYSTEIVMGDHRSVVKAKTQQMEISCDGDRNMYNISVLNDGRSDLAIYGNVLHLIHEHSPIALPNYIQAPDFCVSIDDEYGPIKSSYCFPDHKRILKKTCHGKRCVRKCCQPGYIYDSNLFSCVAAFHSDDLWKPTFYDSTSYNHLASEATDYTLVVGMPLCSDYYSTSTSDIVKLLSNGSLLLEKGNLFFNLERYCLDTFIIGESVQEQAYVCFDEESAPIQQNSCRYIGRKIYPIMLLISSAFLLLTIITYGLVPELRVKIQSRCLLSSITALMVAYISLAFGQLYSNLLTQDICVALGIFIQFSVLASFFWLNVMCFDIWTTLRSIKPSRDAISNPKRKFLLYSLYGWGCPLIISAVTAVLQFSISEQNHPYLYLPKIGKTDCFFSANDPISRWIYLYCFICCLLVINLIFFVHLAVVLIKAQRSNEITLGQKGRSREWVTLYAKLFFVMGVSWLFEVISWHKEVCAVWIATDIINALRGFFIFIIFVCKKDVFEKLRNRNKAVGSQATNTVQSSYLRSSTKNSTRTVDPSERNARRLLENTDQATSQIDDEITIVSSNIN